MSVCTWLATLESAIEPSGPVVQSCEVLLCIALSRTVYPHPDAAFCISPVFLVECKAHYVQFVHIGVWLVYVCHCILSKQLETITMGQGGVKYRTF